MIIVISNPEPVPDEHRVINGLFDAGLDILHLRKPLDSPERVKKLMDNINAEHHGKIALHQHHGLAGDFSIKRLHFTSKNREELAKLNTSFPGFTLSTSVHSVKEMNELDPCFSYCFFGPLFESISKVGYGPASKTGNWPLPASLHTKVVALGGIDESKLVEVRKKGFSHIALLGAIWKSSDPVNTFERIKELWKTKERTY